MTTLTSSSCRICFVACEDSAIDASEVAKIYYDATGYEIFATDTPKKVCKECHDQLMIVKEFRWICECSEKFLEKHRQESLETASCSVEPPVEPMMKVETTELIELSDNETEEEEVLVEEEEPENDEVSEKPEIVLVETQNDDLTFEEYEELEQANKEHRKRMRQLERLKNLPKGHLEQKMLPKATTVTFNPQRFRPQPFRPGNKQVFVNWNYRVLQQFIKSLQKFKQIPRHFTFVAHFDENQFSSLLLAENGDPDPYKEGIPSKNVFSCSFCPYKSGQTPDKQLEMEEHCRVSHKNTFRCFRISCDLKFPCLDMLRYHNLLEHQKTIVLVRPLQCNYCQFSCCFEANMVTHFNKMHKETEMLLKCECCWAEVYCDDLKLQHLVFACPKAKEPALTIPFKRIFMRRDLEAGELENEEILMETGKGEEMQGNFRNEGRRVEEPADPKLNELLGIKHTCDFCFFSTRVFSKLEQHMKVCRKADEEQFTRKKTRESNEVPYKDRIDVCEFCAKEVKASRMALHRAAHKNIKFQCDLCEKSYRRKRDLKDHIEIVHLGIQIHACVECDLSFKFRSGLLLHIKKRHTELDHVCDVCGKRFFNRSILEYHQHSHSDVRTVRCPDCDKMCKSEKHLRIHRKDMHSNKQFPCPICGKIFNNARNLSAHKISHRPNTYFCPVCTNNYSASHALRRHVAEKHPDYQMPPVGTQLKNVNINEIMGLAGDSKEDSIAIT